MKNIKKFFFREIDLFDFTSYFGMDFLKLLNPMWMQKVEQNNKKNTPKIIVSLKKIAQIFQFFKNAVYFASLIQNLLARNFFHNNLCKKFRLPVHTMWLNPSFCCIHYRWNIFCARHFQLLAGVPHGTPEKKKSCFFNSDRYNAYWRNAILHSGPEN